MSNPDFQHIRLSMVKDITVVEIMTKDLQGPKLAKELVQSSAKSFDRSGQTRFWLTFTATGF